MDASGPRRSPRTDRCRRADRRAGVEYLVRRVAADLLNTNNRRNFAMFLTQRLAQLTRVRSVRLNEISGTMSTQVAAADSGAGLCRLLGPGARRRPPGDARSRRSMRGNRPDDWTCQLLEAAASLAGLLLETERLATTPAPLTTAERDGAAPLIGSSEIMRLLRDRVERVANTNFTVLIEGESGVGKELVARQIHDLGPRRQGPFVAINCAALVETLIEAELFGIEERTATGVRGRRGKFEYADGGTLFLDEISDLSMAAQAKLLRVIQDLTVERVGGGGPRQIDTRIVAATNRPLSDLVDRGLFRTDLFYRLSGVEIRVPPLRQRKADILELTQYFLARHEGRGRLTMTPAAVDALIAYDWPGNVRELERMIEGAIATAESRQIRVDDLPVSLRGDYAAHLVPAFQRGDTMRAWGSRYARLVLEKNGGNKRQACRALDISYHTLNAYLRYRPASTRPAATCRRAGRRTRHAGLITLVAGSLRLVFFGGAMIRILVCAAVLALPTIVFGQPRVAAPTFSVGGGDYTTVVMVVVRVSTPGATIRFTQNGLDPTESDPVIVSGSRLAINTSLTLKARAWKAGLRPSEVRSATYRIVSGPGGSPIGAGDAAAGGAQSVLALPDGSVHAWTKQMPSEHVAGLDRRH